MSKQNLTFLFFLLVTLVTTGVNRAAVTYTVTNTATATASGALFESELGEEYSNTMQSAASQFIWMILQQPNLEDRKNVQQVNLFIDDRDGVAYAINDEIHLNANYVGNYSGELRSEFNGVIYHEMTHIWQWNGNGQTPSGLIEGIADYIRLEANYVPNHWVKAGEGDKWDQGYDITARFLEYCNELKIGFVAEINDKMRSGYSDQYFVDILNKSVNQLWSDYKAKYAN